MKNGSRGPGRPRTHPADALHAYVGFKLPAELKHQLGVAAIANNRSTGEEVRTRLAQSFRDDLLLAELREIRRELADLRMYRQCADGVPMSAHVNESAPNESHESATLLRHAVTKPSNV